MTQFHLPYKSSAMGLILCVFLGPIGLLYATFGGGLIMTVVGLIILAAKAWQATPVLWVICCIWSVGAIDAYNKKILFQKNKETLE